MAIITIRVSRLLERVAVPERFRPFVNDYKVNLFEIAFLSREQVNLSQSDFRIVADYFVQKREKGDYIPKSQEFVHVQETLQLLSVVTGDHRFEDAWKDGKRGGPCNMCDVLDRIEKRGIQQGENLLAQLIQKLFALGRIEDVKRVAEDKEYRQMLLKEFSEQEKENEFL